MNKHAKRVATLLAALAATGALAACGGSGGSDDDGTVSGQFEPVEGAPGGYANLTGEATLERADGGTEISISLDGLKFDTAYEGHLHSGGCDQADPGGPHFKFDPSGSEEPPNEIHFDLVSNGEGEGTAKVSSKREVPQGEAGSIVLHLAAEDDEVSSSATGDEVETVFVHEGEHHDDEGHGAEDEIACAELEGGSGATAGAATEKTVVVENGEPVGGVQELEYSAGEEIAFRVESDVADEIHVHGYDLMKDVPAGGSISFSFPAEIEGIFEVELEGRAEQIAEIRVNP
ncbi:MAG TPA: hypothetical protein VGO66_11455 [Solirubrobacterales bacterium]|nr:hypothetical protein [Solirubrobacterales bacterium]